MKITIKFQLIRVGTDTALKLYHSININWSNMLANVLIDCSI